jgi:hypothetical protein
VPDPGQERRVHALAHVGRGVVQRTAVAVAVREAPGRGDWSSSGALRVLYVTTVCVVLGGVELARPAGEAQMVHGGILSPQRQVRGVSEEPGADRRYVSRRDGRAATGVLVPAEKGL